MRQLHVLGVSDDGEALLLGPNRNGTKPSHRIALDEKLRAVVRGQLSAVGTGRSEIALSPKEIQARLRAGASPEQVAKAAQVPVARVLPYAAPVIAERERIVEQARAAIPRRSRGPAAEKPMGEMVDPHLAEVARPESVEWTARRQKDATWLVTVTYAGRGGRRKASWTWRPAERELTAADTAASRLCAPTDVKPKRAATARKAAPKPATAKRTATKKTGATKTAAKKAAAKKAVAKKAVANTSAATKGASKRAAKSAAPRTTRAAASATRRPATAAPAKRTATKATAKPTARPSVVPAPEPPVLTPVAAPRERREPLRAVPPPAPRKPGQRVPIPSWSDVLLGVQGPADEPPAEETAPAAAPRRRRRQA